MAIDTENKRRSVSSYSGHMIAPVADGTIGDADRFHMGWIYAGTSVSSATDPLLPYTHYTFLAQSHTDLTVYLAQTHTNNSNLAQSHTDNEVTMA